MIDAHHKTEALNTKDRLSLEHPKFPKHMLIAVATRCYLMLQVLQKKPESPVKRAT